ncbi:MAG: peptidoglycan DD-metalloendopeptidase family protein [Bacteroidales bacterium]|nr:peptidoglycan DD-metalloendopeptidase family protein [Bacteroidales bacterium]
MNRILVKYSLLMVLFAPALVWADVVTDMHQNRHKQLMKEQEEAVRFQMMSDSIFEQPCVADEEEDPYGNLDVYSDWDDAFVDPLRGKSDAVIPDSQYISFRGYVMPICGKVTSPYGWRRRRMHKGVDLRLAVGDSVRVAWDGRVRIRKNQGRRKGYGLYLVVRHPNGLETVYGHLSKQLVNKNDSVKAGQVIALGGNTGRSTGPHLHLEFRFMGVALDPAELLDFNTFEPKNNLYHFKKKHALLVQEGLAGEGDAAYHRVKKGDTLGGIAWKYNTSVERLCRLNGIRASKTLRIGQRIRYK